MEDRAAQPENPRRVPARTPRPLPRWVGFAAMVTSAARPPGCRRLTISAGLGRDKRPAIHTMWMAGRVALALVRLSAQPEGDTPCC